MLRGPAQYTPVPQEQGYLGRMHKKPHATRSGMGWMDSRQLPSLTWDQSLARLSSSAAITVLMLASDSSPMLDTRKVLPFSLP